MAEAREPLTLTPKARAKAIANLSLAVETKGAPLNREERRRREKIVARALRRKTR